jgi:hypothetical protein
MYLVDLVGCTDFGWLVCCRNTINFRPHENNLSLKRQWKIIKISLWIISTIDVWASIRMKKNQFSGEMLASLNFEKNKMKLVTMRQSADCWEAGTAYPRHGSRTRFNALLTRPHHPVRQRSILVEMLSFTRWREYGHPHRTYCLPYNVPSNEEK